MENNIALDARIAEKEKYGSRRRRRKHQQRKRRKVKREGFRMRPMYDIGPFDVMPPKPTSKVLPEMHLCTGCNNLKAECVCDTFCQHCGRTIEECVCKKCTICGHPKEHCICDKCTVCGLPLELCTRCPVCGSHDNGCNCCMGCGALAHEHCVCDDWLYPLPS